MRIKNMRRTSILLMALMSSVSVTLAGEQATEIKGYNGLYMGHSFFWPSVGELERIVPDSTVVGHKQYMVRSGGAGGSPGNLWKNKNTREKGQRHLDTKKIDLLVVTYYSPANGSVEHYSRWFDYAIAQNPETTFMVAIPWAGHLWADEARRPYLKTLGPRIYDSLIAKLRAKYPKNKVLYCPYGLGTYELIDRLNAGKLSGVKHLLNTDPETKNESRAKKEQLLNDKLGHPGELVAKVGALLWPRTLYDVDLSTLKTKRIKELPDVDFKEIAATVSKKIEPFNAVYKEK